MDGFAVRCADTTTAPVTLHVIAEIPAGAAASQPLEPGQAMAIMTGAPIPPGADGVVPVEDTERPSPDQVLIKTPATPGRYIAPRGSDAKAGAVLLKPGTLMDAPKIAVAASIGAAHVQCFARPRVAVLSTGDELVPVDRTPGPTQIRNSNNAMLVALLQRLGCDVADLGSAPDDPAAIRAAMAEALDAADVLFVTGGMSMGTHDYVPAEILNLRFEIQLSKLRIKPGKPFVFATRPDQKFIFGLPGNPVSGFVCTLRLASRLLTRLAGGKPIEKWVSGRLDAGLGPNGPREFYQPALWTPAVGGTSNRSEFAAVTPMTWKGSADIFTLATANALLVRVENEPPLAKGTLVRVLEL